MTFQYPFIFDVLQVVSPDRLQKAITALVAGDMPITITRQTETEIRAVVQNGTGSAYGVTFTESLTACSCKDALYRGGIYNYGEAVALNFLRISQPKIEAPAPQFSMFHLMWRDGIVLCGDPEPGRVQV